MCVLFFLNVLINKKYDTINHTPGFERKCHTGLLPFFKGNIDYHNELKKCEYKHYVLQHQFFQPAMHALFRNRCVFSISCTCINCEPPTVKLN